MNRNRVERENSRIIGSDHMIAAEFNFLKSKNIEMARALSECKQGCRDLEKERSQMQAENLALSREYREAMKQMKILSQTASKIGKNLVLLSNDVTNLIVQTQSIITKCNEHNNSKESDNNNSAQTSMRTQAVKPMVSGHVIHRPTINLRRLPTEELERMAANISNYSHEDVDEEEENLIEVAVEEEENQEIENDSELENNPLRLNTLPELEEPEPSISGNEELINSAHTPLITGIFKDVNVRVYLTPLQEAGLLPNQNRVLVPLSTSTPSTSQVPVENLESEDIANNCFNQPYATGSRRKMCGTPEIQPASINARKKRRNVSPVYHEASSHVSMSNNEGNSSLVSNWENTGHSHSTEDSLTTLDASSIQQNENARGLLELPEAEERAKIESFRLLGLSPLRERKISTPIDQFKKKLRARPSKPDIPQVSPKKQKKYVPPKMPSCKVMLKRLPLSQRKSLSPIKQRTSSSPRNHNENSPNSSTNSPSSSSRQSTPIKKLYKKARSKSKKQQTLSSLDKTPRPKRSTRPINLKEPLLNCKLRRNN